MRASLLMGGGGWTIVRSPAWARGFPCTVLEMAHKQQALGSKSVRVHQLLLPG